MKRSLLMEFGKQNRKSFFLNFDDIENTGKVSSLLRLQEADPDLSALFNIIGIAAYDISSIGKTKGETELGNLVTDIMRKTSGAHIALVSADMFKGSIPSGELKVEGLEKVISDNRFIHVHQISGEKLLELLTYAFSTIGTEEFVQISGIRVKTTNRKLLSAEILSEPTKPELGYEKIRSDKIYQVAVPEYLGVETSVYQEFFRESACRKTSKTILSELEELFMEKSPVRGYTDGRISFFKDEAISTKKERSDYKFAVISDPHYFAKYLNPIGDAFKKALACDRKLLHLSPELIEEAVEQLIQSDVDMVIIPGDLTKDGEMISHKGIVEQLEKLLEVGKKVSVIPGNHDINNPNAVAFQGKRTIPVKSINPIQFIDIYHDMGYAESFSQDPNSLSYVIEPVPWLRIIAMDSCNYDTNYYTGQSYSGGYFKSDTLNWIINQIKMGEEKGQIVIGFMHHRMIPHSETQGKILSDYIMKDWENTSTLFADSGMHLVISGHLHSQDISSKVSKKGNELWNIQTGSLVTYPSPYRLFTIQQNGEIAFENKFITKLPSNRNLDSYSKFFLYQHLKNRISQMLKNHLLKLGISSKEVEQDFEDILTFEISGERLKDVYARVITDYYGGQEKDFSKLKSFLKKLKNAKNIDLASKVDTVMNAYINESTIDTHAIRVKVRN